MSQTVDICPRIMPIKENAALLVLEDEREATLLRHYTKILFSVELLFDETREQ